MVATFPPAFARNAVATGLACTDLQAAEAISRRRSPRRRLTGLAAMLTVAVPVLTGCGDDDSGGDAGSPTAPSVGEPAGSSPAEPSAASTPSTGTAAGEPVTVTVKTFDFQPDPLTVTAGTTITFVNEDAIEHTVTAGTRAAPTLDRFDGRLPEQGATFDLVLGEPGTYDYFCSRHDGPGMTGQIVVQ